MEIYLIRHTTPKIEKGICYGQSDIELAHSFEEEAQKVLNQLPQQFDVVYSSPLKRCNQLATLINPNYIADPRLKELNFGDWELKKWEDIPSNKITPWYDDWVNVPNKNGESCFQLVERMKSFLDEQSNLNRVAIVTHSGLIRSALVYLNNTDLKDSFKKNKYWLWRMNENIITTFVKITVNIF